MHVGELVLITSSYPKKRLKLLKKARAHLISRLVPEVWQPRIDHCLLAYNKKTQTNKELYSGIKRT
jgi:hypothetical protein